MILDVKQFINEPLSHDEILEKLKSHCRRIDFQERVYPDCAKIKGEINALAKKLPDEKVQFQINQLEERLEEMKVTRKHYVIIAIEEIISVAKSNNWDLCLNCGFVYLYNGAYWKVIDKEGLQKFFGEIAESLSVPRYEARHYLFRDELLKQFYATAHLPKPQKSRKLVLLNFKNGTLEIKSGKAVLRNFNHENFLTYQLPFEYDPSAKCTMWQRFLDEVLCDAERQNVLSEYFASTFVNNDIVKLEKVLMLYGKGSNGKSVVQEVVSALFGYENVSSFSLTSLTNKDGYYRAMIVNKLLNYNSENGVKIESNIFKQLASNEPVEARLPYGQPFQAKDYAKLVFNTNTLPKEGVEQTDAFFRRFLIVPFDVIITDEKQDRELHLKIIANELPGVFNWVIDGLHRLLKQKGFSKCDAATKKLIEYRTQSDSVRSFIEDKGYVKSVYDHKPLKDLYREYVDYCTESGLRGAALKTFSERLHDCGIETKRVSIGNIVYISYCSM